MAEGIESFDEKRNLARVAAGFKGSDWFQRPAVPQSKTFVDGTPPEVKEKLGATSIPQATPVAPWNFRRK